jgi:hypothetical protein
MARRYEEMQRPKTIPWVFASVSSDSWKIDPPVTTSSDGLGFGFGASFRKPIGRSPLWTFAFEVMLRKYADQTLSTSSWQETVEEKILRFNLLVTYTFEKIPLKPYIGTGVFFGAGFNTGSGQPGGSIVPSPFCGVSGWLLNGGIHITNDLLLDFRYEAGGSTGFRVAQASIMVKMGD